MKGIDIPNLNYYTPGKATTHMEEWVPPTAKKAKQYDIKPIKGYVRGEMAE